DSVRPAVVLGQLRVPAKTQVEIRVTRRRPGRLHDRREAAAGLNRERAVLVAFAAGHRLVVEAHGGGAVGVERLADRRVDRETGRRAVQAGDAALVGVGQPQAPVAHAVALRVVHHREGVVVGDSAPVVVLEAYARLGAGVLVADGDRVAEVVAQYADLAQGGGGIGVGRGVGEPALAPASGRVWSWRTPIAWPSSWRSMPTRVRVPLGSRSNDDSSISTLRPKRGSLGKNARARYWPWSTGRTSNTTDVLAALQRPSSPPTWMKSRSATASQAAAAACMSATTRVYLAPKVSLTQ